MIAAVTAITGFAGVSAASASRAPATSPLARISGRLMVAHGDSFGGGPMVMQAELQTSSGNVALSVPAAAHTEVLALAGTRVQVQGAEQSASFAASTVTALPSAPVASAHAAPAVAVSRPMRIAVVLMRLPGSTAEPVGKAAVQASTFGATNSVANWYAQTSGGQVKVTGTVYGYYSGVRSCDLAAQTAAAEAAAKQDGYVASNFDNLVVYTPAQSCDFAGIGWVGANGVFLNGSVDRGVMEHELGHNLGLLHAGEYECGVAAPAPSCLVDYGDPTDVMGGTDTNHGFNAEHKYMLGWIPASEVATVSTGTRIIALTASEHPLVAGSTELIRVQAADGTMYAIDRRASVGYDAGLSGVWVRRVADVNTDDTELVRGSALTAGLTFTDKVHHVSISTLADSGPTASVRVCVGACVVSTGTQTVAGTTPATGVARNVATGARTALANAGLTLTVPAGHGVVAGHTIVVSTYSSRAPGAVSCSDNRGNVYTVNVNSVGDQRLIVCSARATHALLAGATITTRYPSFNGSAASSVNDFAGIVAAPRVDRKLANGASGVAVNSGTTPATSHAAEIVFGVEIHRGASTFASTGGYKRVGAAIFFSGSERMTITPEFKIVSATGAFSFGGALTSAQSWRAAIVTFFTS